MEVGVDGSDVDVGAAGSDLHNLPFPAGSEMRLCLSGCDGSTDPLCAADGGAVTIAGNALAAPIPINAANQAICLSINFTTAPNGTANVQSGALDLTAGLTGRVFVDLLPFGPTTKICPRCSGATPGAAGTCDSGARSGLACVTDDVVTVPDQPGGSQDYAVSRDCLPRPAPRPS